MGYTKISQYLHRPNLTELGMGNTHETYMLINSDTNLSSLFPPAVETSVKDYTNGKSYILKSAKSNEFRVNQMGEIYREYDIYPGDEIIFTKKEKSSTTEIYLEINKYNRVVFITDNKGAEILNLDRLAVYDKGNNTYELKTVYEGNDCILTISFKNAQKKRKDSPNDTDFYDIKIDGKELPKTKDSYYLELKETSELLLLPKSSYNVVEFRDNLEEKLTEDIDENKVQFNYDELSENYKLYLTALRTKPFMLLAGISGTGKSRIVKDMAFQTCPNVGDLRSDNVSPGNYCLVEVKPNWHDSTELLGYDSVISGGYIVTKFVKFLVKAMLNDDIPFFVCLDEMNLAPVEQYFAEFLSVLESRKKEGEEITSEALIDASVFKKHEATLFADLFDKEVKKTSPYGVVELTEDKAHYGKEYEVYERLKQEGLRIPKNLIVIGTVNMDETTHQFSRKVIDRAMTIEMNIAEGEQPFKDFFASDSELKYYDNPLSANLFLPKNVTAKQAMDELDLAEQDKLKDLVPERLAAINNALDGTPFKIAYRVQNELLIYYCEMRRIDTETKTSELLNKAIDGILIMKVLPRVEGDRDLLEKPLEKLANICNDGYPEAYKKIKEMQGRLESAPFTSFWP